MRKARVRLRCATARIIAAAAGICDNPWINYAESYGDISTIVRLFWLNASVGSSMTPVSTSHVPLRPVLPVKPEFVERICSSRKIPCF